MYQKVVWRNYVFKSSLWFNLAKKLLNKFIKHNFYTYQLITDTVVKHFQKYNVLQPTFQINAWHMKWERKVQIYLHIECIEVSTNHFRRVLFYGTGCRF